MGMTDQERRLLLGTGVLCATSATWPQAPPIERLAVKPRVAATMLGESRTTIYRLVNAGKLDAVKSGSSTLVLTASIRRYLENLPRFGATAA
jgi:excisionase family DNA binding protein